MSEILEVSAQDVQQRLGSLRVIDVREPHEFHGPLGHIPGAMLVPLGVVEQAADVLPKERVVLAVCRSGRRSARACEILAAHGHRAINLAGGMIAWSHAGLIVERRDPASTAEARDAIAAWFAQLARCNAPAARREIERELEAAGSTWSAPSAAALDRALTALADALSRETPPPPDLEVSVDVFRKALAVL